MQIIAAAFFATTVLVAQADTDPSLFDRTSKKYIELQKERKVGDHTNVPAGEGFQAGKDGGFSRDRVNDRAVDHGE